MSKVKLGAYLKEKRLKAGLTQDHVARQLGYTSAQFVSNWERGLCNPALTALPTLSRLYNVPEREMIHVMIAEYRNQLLATFKR